MYTESKNIRRQAAKLTEPFHFGGCLWHILVIIICLLLGASYLKKSFGGFIYGTHTYTLICIYILNKYMYCGVCLGYLPIYIYIYIIGNI